MRWHNCIIYGNRPFSVFLLSQTQIMYCPCHHILWCYHGSSWHSGLFILEYINSGVIQKPYSRSATTKSTTQRPSSLLQPLLYSDKHLHDTYFVWITGFSWILMPSQYHPGNRFFITNMINLELYCQSTVQDTAQLFFQDMIPGQGILLK